MTQTAIIETPADTALALPADYEGLHISREDMSIPSIVLWQKMTDMPGSRFAGMEKSTRFKTLNMVN